MIVSPSHASSSVDRSAVLTRNLNDVELGALDALAEELVSRFETAESEFFADEAGRMALALPISLRHLGYEFRLGRAARVLRLRGLALDEATLMPTPPSWDTPWIEPRILKLEVCHALIASLLGDIFGWHTQENGRFFRHIIPNPEDAREQLGSSSDVDLEWHNEEAFHPARADWIVLMCYRNHERAVTTVCPTSLIKLDTETAAILRQRRFVITPDKSHRPQFNSSSHWQLGEQDFERIEAMLSRPEPLPLLTGPALDPFIRVDPAFMRAVDLEAQRALERLRAEIDAKLIDVVLESGDFLLIDNLRAVHGRRAYEPLYGPRQRWMRRVNVARDLAKGGDNLVAGPKRRFL